MLQGDCDHVQGKHKLCVVMAEQGRLHDKLTVQAYSHGSSMEKRFVVGEVPQLMEKYSTTSSYFKFMSTVCFPPKTISIFEHFNLEQFCNFHISFFVNLCLKLDLLTEVMH